MHGSVCAFVDGRLNGLSCILRALEGHSDLHILGHEVSITIMTGNCHITLTVSLRCLLGLCYAAGDVVDLILRKSGLQSQCIAGHITLCIRHFFHFEISRERIYLACLRVNLVHCVVLVALRVYGRCVAQHPIIIRDNVLVACKVNRRCCAGIQRVFTLYGQAVLRRLAGYFDLHVNALRFRFELTFAVSAHGSNQGVGAGNDLKGSIILYTKI